MIDFGQIMTTKSAVQMGRQILPEVFDLNNKIKSRIANLREQPYTGGVWIECDGMDCDMAPTITLDLTCGTDGGDREQFLQQVLLARFVAKDDDLKLLFGENAKPLRPVYIQQSLALYEGESHTIRLWTDNGEQALLTVKSKDSHTLLPWIQCLTAVFRPFDLHAVFFPSVSR